MLNERFGLTFKSALLVLSVEFHFPSIETTQYFGYMLIFYFQNILHLTLSQNLKKKN